MNELTEQEIDAIHRSNPKWALYLATEYAREFAEAVAEAQRQKSSEQGAEEAP